METVDPLWRPLTGASRKKKKKKKKSNFLKYHAINSFNPISQLWRITLKFQYPDPDLHQNWIGFTLSQTQLVSQVSSKISPQRFEISCFISLLVPSLNGEESLQKILVSRSGPSLKPESSRPRHTPHLPTKFHPNPFITFRNIVLYDLLYSFWSHLSMVKNHLN